MKFFDLILTILIGLFFILLINMQTSSQARIIFFECPAYSLADYCTVA